MSYNLISLIITIDAKSSIDTNKIINTFQNNNTR
jgi:hypothetical protein